MCRADPCAIHGVDELYTQKQQIATPLQLPGQNDPGTQHLACPFRTDTLQFLASNRSFGQDTHFSHIGNAIDEPRHKSAAQG
jgi:hypothetical protein